MSGRLFLGIFLLFFLGMVSTPVLGEALSLRLVGDWAYSQTGSKSEDRESGEVTDSQSDRFQQTYRLDLSKRLFPTLNLNSGAQVEHNQTSSESDGTETDNRNQQILPYVDVEWRQSLFSLSGGYRERFARSEGSVQQTQKDYVTSYNLRGEWRPIKLPRLEVNYLHLERHDEPLTVDTESDTLLLNSRFDFKDYEIRYNYLAGKDTNRINNTATLTKTHNGRVRFNKSFYDNRVSVSAGLRTEYSTLEFSGSGLRDFAVSPAGSQFFFIDTDALPNNNDPDIDYQTGDFGDNLDLNGNDILDVGLEFSEAVSVDKLQLRIAVDDSLDFGSNIDRITNWAVYTSDDQESWQLRALASVQYLREDNLFELVLNSGSSAEYFMVVYSPPLVTNQIGLVRVSGIRAFISRDLKDGSHQNTQTYQSQLGVGWQVTKSTRIAYSLNFQKRRSSLFDEQNTKVNNGFSIIHLFNDIFTGTGRVSAGYSWDQGDLKSSNYSYSARLSARYLETLNQSLIYSGTFDHNEDDGDDISNSLILRTNAALYQGWDLSFDQGLSWQSSDNDDDSSNYFLRIQSSLVPHDSYNLIAEYSINWDDDGSGRERSDSGRLRAFWVPRDTMSFSGEVRLRKSAEGDEQISWEYSASWLPLRDGSLQCNLAYSEEEDQDGHRTWSFSPNLTWAVTHYSTLGLRYSLGTQETNSEINDFETVFLSFRVFYE